MIQLFTLPDLIHKFPDLLDFVNLPPCDIQIRAIDLNEKEETNSAVPAASSSPANASAGPVVVLKKRYELEIWVPFCNEDFSDVRPLYYPATASFVVVFSIKCRESFNEVKEKWLPEVLQYTNPKFVRENTRP